MHAATKVLREGWAPLEPVEVAQRLDGLIGREAGHKVKQLPTTAYWSGLMDWIRGTLVTERMIDPEDVDLIRVIDDPAEVVSAIFDHYEKRGFEPSAREREAHLNL